MESAGKRGSERGNERGGETGGERRGGGGGEADKEGAWGVLTVLWMGVKQRKQKVRMAPSMGTYNRATLSTVVSYGFMHFVLVAYFAKIVCPNNCTIATLHHSSAQVLRIKSVRTISGDGRGRRDSTG